MVDALLKLPPLPPTASSPSVRETQKTTQRPQKDQLPFADVLNRQAASCESLTFSAHAQARLATRSIQLTTQQIARLEDGVQQAAQKGAKDSLVMMDNLAFIVSVRNRTIVTAVDGAAKQGNVFTQIDSAVIV
jgi:flagellar operon protein